MRVNGKVAVVSGAGGPMGGAIARRLAEEGARLAITDISGARLAVAAEEIKAIQNEAGLLAHRADVRVQEECEAFAAATLTRFGRVDILVNVVGGIRSQPLFRPFLTMSEERWDDTFTLNLKPNFFLVKAFAPGMLEAEYGRIINLSSINFAGEMGSADYSAAKAAVASLTRTLAIELAPHITVNCIAPGTIRTRAIERFDSDELERYAAKPLLKRLGEPSDVANAALFLASDESSYITGEILSVSGGIWPAL